VQNVVAPESTVWVDAVVLEPIACIIMEAVIATHSHFRFMIRTSLASRNYLRR
jgi:hypothetical protein